MDIGFTGTQHEAYLTEERKARLQQILIDLWRDDEEMVFHHGDCIGADEYAAKTARRLKYKIVGHPPTNATKRAYVISDLWLEPKPYLVRNKSIVNASRILVAMPRIVGHEELRSGTWATIRYARMAGREVRQV